MTIASLKSRSAIAIALIAAAALGYGLLLPAPVANAEAPAPAPPPASVEIAAASAQDFAAVQWVPGSVISRADARIASEQSGRVLSIVEVGERVRRGEVLARLDDEALAIKQRQDEAASRRIAAQLQFATHQADRLLELKGKSSIAETQLDQARSERDTLVQELARAEATLAETRRQLNAATIRAPFGGVVAERMAQVGEFLSAGAPVLRLVDTTSVEVRAQAPVALARSLRADDVVSLREGDTVVQQHIRAVVPVGDDSSRQLEVRVSLAGAEWPVGTAIEVALPQGAARSAVAVPRDALILRGADTWVFRIKEDSTAERLAVETGLTMGDWIEVRGAVAAGDKLVVRGGERLQPGQRVAINSRG